MLIDKTKMIDLLNKQDVSSLIRQLNALASLLLFVGGLLGVFFSGITGLVI